MSFTDQDEADLRNIVAGAKSIKGAKYGSKGAWGRQFGTDRKEAPASPPTVAPMGDQKVLDAREKAAGMKKGGSVSRDGAAQRGRTRAKGKP